jgi:axial budding pattern protein 2
MKLILQLLFSAQLLSSIARGEPIVSFPYNAQLPPVARTGSLYSYSFSPHTFRSDSNLTYTLGVHPSWLSLEGDERRLYGIPEDAAVPPGEVVGQAFEIIATDGTGSVTMKSTIVVSRDQGPSVKIPISEQIKTFGDYSAPSSILSYPSTDFSYSFSMKTFEHEPGMINYYASSGDSSPLPAWIAFDAATLTFSGRTPGADALHQPPQAFDIRLVASDIEGFSSISVEFSIVVSSHKVTTDKPVIRLNATRGSSLKYDGLANGIKLDGQLVKPGELNVTVTSLPNWLSFDFDTWIIEGAPKKGDRTSNFTMNFKDSDSDALEVWGEISIATGLFETTFPDVEVMPGEDFSLDLSSNFRDPDDIEVKIHSKPEQEWLSLKGFEIEGKVPKHAKGKMQVLIEATSKSSAVRETEELQMNFLAPDGKTTTIPSATSSTGQPRKTNDDPADKDENESGVAGISTTTVLLATILPILAIALLIMMLVCCLRRRRTPGIDKKTKKPRKKISNPIMEILQINGSAQHVERLDTADEAEPHVLRNEKPRYAVALPRRSSQSSYTLRRLSSRDMMREYRTHDAGNERRQVTSDTETEAGQSWYTVERTPTGFMSRPSTRSRRSDTTVPMSTHQLLPTPPFLAHLGDSTFRGGLELTIPTLDEMPSLQLDPEPADHRLTGFYSNITSSSAALPSSKYNSPKIGVAIIATAGPASTGHNQGAGVGQSASDRDWTMIRESEYGEHAPELTLPSHVRLSSQQWPEKMKMNASWLGNDSLSGLGSLVTDSSFGSTENWRVIGHHKQREPSISAAYKDLIRTNPFYPSGFSGSTAEHGTAYIEERAASSLRESNSWFRHKASASQFSKLNADEKSNGGPPNWRREESGKKSEGSYTAFL